MANEHDRGWRARLARRRNTPDDEVRVRPMAAVGWMLATVLAVIGVTAGVWFWLRGKSDIELSAARIALTAGGGAGAGVGLMLAFRRQQHQEKATVLTDRDAVERRINDRYTAAIDQLGSDKLDVRLGGIYALERIAADSRRDHPTVIDVLCTFVREHTRADASDDTDPVLAAWTATDDPLKRREPTPSSPAADVQAALTVIGRRTIEYDTRTPDLRGANLRDANLYRADLLDADLTDANLRDANLRRANLRNAELRDAKLCGANLRGADLSGANLRGADLSGANLRDADLRDADLGDADLGTGNLRDADLRDADLSGADLHHADLHGANMHGADLVVADLSSADLSGANLRDANLVRTDLSGARHNWHTQWPEGFTPPPSAQRTDPASGDADT